MRLAHALVSLPAANLRALADGLAIVDLPGRREAAAERIEEAMRTQVGFERVWSRLPEDAKRVMAIAALEMRSDGYINGIARSRLFTTLERQYRASDDPVAAVELLMGAGLLTHTQIWYIGDGFEIPETILPPLYACLARFLTAGPILAGMVDPVDAMRAGHSLSRDMVRFAAYASNRTISVTKAGVLYKREGKRLLPLFRTAGFFDLEVPAGWEGIPYAVYLGLRMLERLSILHIGEGTFSLSGEKLSEFLTLPEEQLHERIRQEAALGPRSGHGHLFGILEAWWEKAPKGVWIHLTHAFFSQIGCLAEEPAWYPSVLYWTGVMALCGFMELARSTEGMPVLRIAESQPVGEARWVVQPNFELLVPEEAPLTLHFLAGQIANLERADAMSVYRLTRESTLSLCDRGWTLADICGPLCEFSGMPVPAGIERALRDWIDEYDRAVLWDALVIKFRSSAVAESFCRDPRAADVMLDRLGDAAVLVKRTAEKRVREILADSGATAPAAVRYAPEDAAALAERRGKRVQGFDTRENRLSLRRLTGPSCKTLVAPPHENPFADET